MREVRMRLRLLAFAVAAGALVVACGGGDESGSDDGGDGGQPGANTTATATNGNSADGTSSPAATATKEANPKERLLASADRLDKSNYHVTYEIAVESDEGAFTGEMTISAKPPKQAYQLLMKTSEGESTIIGIDDGESTYFCLKGEGTGASEAGCMKTATEGGIMGEGDQFFVNVDDLLREAGTNGDITVEDLPGERIAGRQADCYAVTDKGETGKVCIASDDGFLVLTEGTFEGSTVSLTLKDYSDNPPDSVFEPPYPVQGSLFGGGQ